MTALVEREADLVERLRSLAGRSDTITAIALRDAADAILALHRPGAEYRRGLLDAARVAETWASSLRPGTVERASGHAEARRDIATAIRALSDSIPDTKGGRDGE